MEIKVSVIVPVYNVKDYLRQCMDSLVNQTLQDIEIIAVDDGSNDGSQEILQEYKIISPNLLIIQQENQGASVARNNGLNYAKGKYVIYVDSDDYLELDCLEQLYRVAKEKNAEVVVYSHKEIYEKEGVTVNIKLEANENQEYSGIQIANMMLEGKILGTPWNKLVKRKLLLVDKINFEQGRTTEDWFPMFKKMYQAHRIYFLNKTLYYYRIRNNSVTTQKNEKNLVDYIYAANQIVEFALNNKMDINKIECFKSMVFLNIINRKYCMYNWKKMYVNKDCGCFEIDNLDVCRLNMRDQIYVYSFKFKVFHLLKKVESILKKLRKK